MFVRFMFVYSFSSFAIPYNYTQNLFSSLVIIIQLLECWNDIMPFDLEIYRLVLFLPCCEFHLKCNCVCDNKFGDVVRCNSSHCCFWIFYQFPCSFTLPISLPFTHSHVLRWYLQLRLHLRFQPNVSFRCLSECLVAVLLYAYVYISLCHNAINTHGNGYILCAIWKLHIPKWLFEKYHFAAECDCQFVCVCVCVNALNGEKFLYDCNNYVQVKVTSCILVWIYCINAMLYYYSLSLLFRTLFFSSFFLSTKLCFCAMAYNSNTYV